MSEPSWLNSTPVGYQPVGMNPSTRLSPAREMSTIATALLSALATTSRWPSGDTASAFGVDPAGASGYSDTEICSIAFARATSTTQTTFVLAHATNSRAPSTDHAIAFGCSPTATSPFSARVAGSNSITRAPPQRETYSVVPSGDSRHVYGSAGSLTVVATAPEARSMDVTTCPKTWTAKTWEPSRLAAMPPTNVSSAAAGRVSPGRSAGMFFRAAIFRPACRRAFVHENAWTVLDAAPEEYSVFPSGAQARPSHASSIGR